MSKRGRTVAPALLILFVAGFFVWMMTRPFENYFGVPGGTLEVHFGIPVHNAVYTYFGPGQEELDLSRGLADEFKLAGQEIFRSERPIDQRRYRIFGKLTKGLIIRRYWLENGEWQIVEEWVDLISLPPEAKIILEDGRRKVRERWPEDFPGVVSFSGSSLEPK